MTRTSTQIGILALALLLALAGTSCGGASGAAGITDQLTSVDGSSALPGGTNDPAVQGTTDNNGVDPAGHDINDDNGVDPAGHDINDDNGVDPAGHDANDDNGVDPAGHDAGDDHGSDG